MLCNVDVVPSGERDVELTKEAHRQEENDKLRKEFAKHANTFHLWLTETRLVKPINQSSVSL